MHATLGCEVRAFLSFSLSLLERTVACCIVFLAFDVFCLWQEVWLKGSLGHTTLWKKEVVRQMLCTWFKSVFSDSRLGRGRIDCPRLSTVRGSGIGFTEPGHSAFGIVQKMTHLRDITATARPASQIITLSIVKTIDVKLKSNSKNTFICSFFVKIFPLRLAKKDLEKQVD